MLFNNLGQGYRNRPPALSLEQTFNVGDRLQIWTLIEEALTSNKQR